MLNAQLTVKRLVVTYGLYRAWRMISFERTYRQMHGRTWRFHNLNNTGPGTLAYKYSINAAMMIVMTMWFASQLDSWRGLRFHSARGY